MNRSLAVLVGCLAALTLAACASTPPVPEESSTQPPPPTATETPVTPTPETAATPGAEVQVTGVVLYRERIALSPAAVVKVEVVEAGQGGEGTVLAEQTLRSPGQVPIPFSVAVAAERIRPEGAYLLRASIEDNGRRYATPQPVPVLTQGQPSSDVQVLVRPGG